MYQILVGEHQQRLADDLSRRLSSDFLVHLVGHTWQTTEAYRQHTYDAIMLESSLPANGGFSACSELRRMGCGSTIFVIGASDVIDQHEQAFKSGADGYLCSEFGTRDIAARVKAAIRRRMPRGYSKELVWRDLILDLDRKSLKAGANTVTLRPKELALLECLMRNQNTLYSANQLWHDVWRKPGMASDTVRTTINGVRKKLRKLDAPGMIETVNGLGYKVIAP